MTAYYWKDRQPVEMPHSITTGNEAKSLGVIGCHCVDTHFSANDPEFRYGWFSPMTGAGRHHDWEHVPLSEFDPEFRTWLLLLGVG